MYRIHKITLIITVIHEVLRTNSRWMKIQKVINILIDTFYIFYNFAWVAFQKSYTNETRFLTFFNRVTGDAGVGWEIEVIKELFSHYSLSSVAYRIHIILFILKEILNFCIQKTSPSGTRFIQVILLCD